ncbi:MAG TPA: NADH-quinone oxidoreductase subunit A [Polyangiaceae bacterium]|jgi:NADH-quinone oxidoreductase subunit A|nr:NADH-quinone oxidoreductase subunit A [Polyangiaceae bacterium]
MSYELAQFAPIAVLLAMGAALGLGGLVVPSLIGKRRFMTRVKDTPYECGMPPMEGSSASISVKFYLVAMLFILFDLEVVFIVSWATIFRDLVKPEDFGGIGPAALWSVVVFIFILEAGHFYAWKQGALTWAPLSRRAPRRVRDARTPAATAEVAPAQVASSTR